jgi:hypothetical protein
MGCGADMAGTAIAIELGMELELIRQMRSSRSRHKSQLGSQCRALFGDIYATMKCGGHQYLELQLVTST